VDRARAAGGVLITQLEGDVRSLNETRDFMKGAWWAFCGAAGLFIAMIAVAHRFLGKHIAIALVEHHQEHAKPKSVSASGPTT
jgi:hypothetical protein